MIDYLKKRTLSTRFSFLSFFIRSLAGLSVLGLRYRDMIRIEEPNYFHLPSGNSEWSGYMTFVYVQSYRRRGLSVNALSYLYNPYVYTATFFTGSGCEPQNQLYFFFLFLYAHLKLIIKSPVFFLEVYVCLFSVISLRSVPSVHLCSSKR